MDSALYEARHSFVWNFGADLLPLLAPQAGERILDLGCGTGQLTARIAASGASVVGLDRSPEMIGQARQNYPNLEFRLGDATNFSMETQADAVFSNAALHWMLDAGAVVRNIAASLRPGGRFIAEFGGKRNVRAFSTAAKTVLEHRGLEYKNPWYFPSLAAYASLLEQHGFEVNAAWHFDRPTALDDGVDALRDWITMFGTAALSAVPKALHNEVVQEIEELLRADLYREGRWHMDYVRLRVVAKLGFKPDPLN